VHYGTALAIDYFKNVHGRKDIVNSDKELHNRVYHGYRSNNAYWNNDCFCMIYGDGDGKRYGSFVSLDIVGHELTHGVTGSTAKLTYWGESGCLNEATSDIFGSSIEFYANNEKDSGDYLIGEKIALKPQYFLRNMSEPGADGQSIDHYSLYTKDMILHYGSGIANNFFYLLAESGTNKTSGLTVAGIGRMKAEKIWYRALTIYMTSGTTFADARIACLKAAGDLYGEGSIEQNAVAASWTAVGVE
jgi:zinc metalloprotease ZmpA